MKNKLKAYPKLPIELNSTKDAIVVLERLRLRPVNYKSVWDYATCITHTFGTHKDGACDESNKVLARIKETLRLHDANLVKLTHEIYIGDPIGQIPSSFLASTVRTAPYAAWNIVVILSSPSHIRHGAPEEGKASDREQ
jgi:hypothetical protein